MKDRLTLCLLLAVLLCTCAPPPENSGPGEGRPPNLLIVLSDQHSYDMLGAYGNEQVITPHLDRFASEATLLTHAFANQPVCTPYRGMILSGMQPLKNGAFVNDVPLLPSPDLLGNVLKARGYQTAYIGKWHLLGGDRKRPVPEGELRYGFDTLLTNNCHVDFRPGKAFFWNAQGEREFFEKWEVYGQTDQALAYLDGIDPDRPFALIVSWHPPHDWGKFEGEDGKMHYRYDTMEDLMGLYDRDSIRVRPGIEPTPDLLRMYHGYMAAVTGVDRAFGQLTDKLRERGLEDNTLMIFSADHGDMLESHDAWLPKQFPHDYSTRIPFIVRMPGRVPAGHRSDLLFGALDIMPTVLGLMDIETGKDYDGQDLSTALVEKDDEAVASVPLWLYKRGVAPNKNWRGIVTRDWTFSMGRGEDSMALTNVLFDRRNDPYQLENLFHDPSHAEKKEELRAMTYAWMKTYGDEFFGTEEFLAVRPAETWMYDYEHSPYDLLVKKEER